MNGPTPPDFWSFSCAVYRLPGIAPACLELQDALDLDVNLLLFCLWWSLGDGAPLDAAAFTVVLQAARPWHDDVVRPLRAARRGAKPKPSLSPDDRATTFYRQVLAIELDAEQAEQALIAQAAHTASAGPPASAQAPEVRLERHLALYLGSLGRPISPPSRAALEAILATSCPAIDNPGAVVAAACRAAEPRQPAAGAP